MFDHLTRNVSAALLVTSTLFLTACGGGSSDSEAPAEESKSADTGVEMASNQQPSADPAANSNVGAAGALSGGALSSGAPAPSKGAQPGSAFGGQAQKKTESAPSFGSAQTGAGNVGAKTQATKQPVAPSTPTATFDTHVVVAEPAELNLGEIPTNDSKVGTVMLHNTSDTPMRLVDCKSSCGCTAAKCPKGTTIQPGESTEIEVRMRGGNVEKDINKRVTFTVEGQPPLIVPVNATAVAFVSVDPMILEKEALPDGGVLTLKSKDGGPFRITRMHPPLMTEFSAEAAGEHTINVKWDLWEQLGSSRKLTFYLDHPLCTKVLVTVRAPISGRNTPTVDATKTPSSVAASPELMISRGQTDQILEQIEEGKLQLSYRNRAGAPLLSLALEKGNVDLAEALLEKGAGVEDSDDLGKTPIMYAAQSKNADLVHLLLEQGAKVTVADPAVGTALCWAAAFGDEDSVVALIDAGAPIEEPARMTGFTPLIWAAGVGNAGAVQAIVDAGASLESVDLTPVGATALMHAARTGRVDNIAILIKAGADIEARSRAKKTPLLVAAEASGSDVATLKTIVDAGADVTATDERGRNALDLAANRTDPRAADVVAYLETIIDKSDG